MRADHRIDKVALAAGLLFLLIGVSHVLGEAWDRRLDPAWVLAAVLVGLGVIGLMGVLRPRPPTSLESTESPASTAPTDSMASTDGPTATGDQDAADDPAATDGRGEGDPVRPD